MKIAVIADLHYAGGANPAIASRRGEIADLLLHRAIHRINRLIKPDVAVILGDIVNDGQSPDAETLLEQLAKLLKGCSVPWLIIPGNHDNLPLERFYAHFPRPPDWVDVAGVRLVPFIDPEEPGYNARREAHDIERMRAARSGWAGPIVSLQHTPLFAPGLVNCPYNYINATEILAVMRECGIGLAISGHFHPAYDLVRTDGIATVAAPALCEIPFGLLVVEIDGDRVTAARHDLRLPPELGLVDTHVHTHLAYCAENMDIRKTFALARDFGLGGVFFAEHSGQLYFDAKNYWGGACLEQGMSGAVPAADRSHLYFDALAAARCPASAIGMELDAAYDGSVLVRAEHEARLALRLGAVHGLAALRGPQPDMAKAQDEFLFLVEALLKHGIHSLAHPFRVFRRGGAKCPEALFAPTVRLLRQYKTAAELNFHTNEPPPAFVRLCLDAGVPFTFGSDAHNLYEIGEFALQLELLRACGFNGDLKDVLLPVRAVRFHPQPG
ncbi:MAG: hypothetical protein A3K19_05275 [Lentisphaerae bacterium RIFOXYB12_FULL_65_16]|nr:MAG: hypothetical protein A3K18_02565 [Lentisphaerae bacterium RIFOXYA12_64_32]OGV84148.1 MAG: hypothetical protein A3K19_05275 [Lentisphaerae bacterium RIFOXYB12_FULL_65_16]